jgi:hypothetical protein
LYCPVTLPDIQDKPPWMMIGWKMEIFENTDLYLEITVIHLSDYNIVHTIHQRLVMLCLFIPFDHNIITLS